MCIRDSVKTNHLNRLLPIRTYNELLFQIPGMVSCKPDADVAASVITGSNLMALLENTHEGDFPCLLYTSRCL